MQLKTFFFNLAESKYPLCHEFICFHPPICTFSACSSMRPCPGRGRAAPLTQICCLKFNGSSVAWGLLLFIKTQLERVAPTASLILSLCASWTLTLTSAALLDMDWVFFSSSVKWCLSSHCGLSLPQATHSLCHRDNNMCMLWKLQCQHL